MPCQDDWLNDLSSMPPVSVTMQARNLLLADGPLDVLPDGAVLEPQAVASMAITLNAAAAAILPLTLPPVRGPPYRGPGKSDVAGAIPVGGISRPGSPPG